MKCIKCGANTPFRATSSLCPQCGGTRTRRIPSAKTRFLQWTFFFIVAVTLLVMVIGSRDPQQPSQAAANPASDTWSGTGPDCTLHGHPDPAHEGVIISDRGTSDCPPEPGYDADALEKQFGLVASEECRDQADAYLKANAVYDYRWDRDFDGYLMRVVDANVLQATASSLELQNGFGAYRRVLLICDYDTKSSKVLGFRVN